MGLICWTSSLTLIFGTNRMAELPSLYTNHTLPPQGNSLVLISIKRLSELHSYSIQALVIGHLKISTDPTRNRNQNLVSWGTVPQSTALLSKGYFPVFWFSPVSINPHSFWLYIQFQHFTASLHDTVNLSQHGHSPNQNSNSALLEYK